MAHLAHLYHNPTGEYLGTLRENAAGLVHLGMPRYRDGEPVTIAAAGEVVQGPPPVRDVWPVPPAWHNQQITDWALQLCGAVADHIAPDLVLSMTDLGQIIGRVNTEGYQEPDIVDPKDAKASTTSWAPPPLWAGRSLTEYTAAIAAAAAESPDDLQGAVDRVNLARH